MSVSGIGHSVRDIPFLYSEALDIHSYLYLWGEKRLITDEDIKDFRIRAHFTEGESLDQMLDLLQPAGNFSYSKTNDTILIHSKLN